jgi:hypothetical protein
VPPRYEILLSEFWKLSSERQLGFSAGPIPHSRVVEAGERLGLDSAMMPVFELIIRRMDQAFLRWVGAEQERKRKSDGGLQNPSGSRHQRRTPRQGPHQASNATAVLENRRRREIRRHVLFDGREHRVDQPLATREKLPPRRIVHARAQILRRRQDREIGLK